MALTSKLILNIKARLTSRAGKQIKKQTALNYLVSLYENSPLDLQIYY